MSYIFFSALLPTSPHTSTLSHGPQAPNSQEVLPFSTSHVVWIHVCLYYCLHCCLGSIGFWTVGLFSLIYVQRPLMSEYIWYLSFWVYVTTLNLRYFRSIHLPQISRCLYFFLLGSSSLCKCTIFSYPFSGWVAFRLFPGSDYDK